MAIRQNENGSITFTGLRNVHDPIWTEWFTIDHVGTVNIEELRKVHEAARKGAEDVIELVKDLK